MSAEKIPSESFIERLKKQWMDTVDAVPDPLLLISRDYKILRSNKALELRSGRNVRELVGEHCYKALAGRKSPCEGCRLDQEFSKKKIPIYGISVDVPTSAQFEVTWKAVEENNQPYILHVYRDVTERKKLQDQITQSEKLAAVGTLAGGFAHEMNNPLGGILIFAQMLLREMDPGSQHYTDVKEIEQASLRAKKIVEDLLRFARNEPNTRELHHIKLKAAVEKAAQFAFMAIQGKKWQIDSSDVPADLEVLADEQALIQVLLNLFTNSLQAMKKGGHVAVKVQSTKKNHVMISVQDDGPGIPEKLWSKIFDPFFTTKEPGEGTGLGLSIAFRLLEEMGGTIEIKSSSVGALFLISLKI